jgi:hypothetical protein
MLFNNNFNQSNLTYHTWSPSPVVFGMEIEVDKSNVLTDNDDDNAIYIQTIYIYNTFILILHSLNTCMHKIKNLVV